MKCLVVSLFVFVIGIKLIRVESCIFYRGMKNEDKIRTDANSRRVKRERWVLRSLKLKKESDPANSHLLCEEVEEVTTVLLPAISTEVKEGGKMEALHHGNSQSRDAHKYRSLRERWIVKSLKLEKENSCRGVCPGLMEEEDTDVEEVGVVYLDELVEERSDDSDFSTLHEDYLHSSGENLWDSDLEIHI